MTVMMMVSASDPVANSSTSSSSPTAATATASSSSSSSAADAAASSGNSLTISTLVNLESASSPASNSLLSSSSSSSSPTTTIQFSSSPPQFPSSSDVKSIGTSPVNGFPLFGHEIDIVSGGIARSNRSNRSAGSGGRHQHQHHANHHPYSNNGKGNSGAACHTGVSRLKPAASSSDSSSSPTSSSCQSTWTSSSYHHHNNSSSSNLSPPAATAAGASCGITGDQGIRHQSLKSCLDQLLCNWKTAAAAAAASSTASTTTSFPINPDPIDERLLQQQVHLRQQQHNTITGLDPKELILAAAIILKNQQQQQSSSLGRFTSSSLSSSSGPATAQQQPCCPQSGSSTITSAVAPKNCNTCRCNGSGSSSSNNRAGSNITGSNNNRSNMNRLMHHPIQMKAADSENRNERKLFVGMLSKKLTESEVRDIFSPHGVIEECTILRDSSGGSRGCSFITFTNRASAISAIKSLHQKQTLEGCTAPMVVKFADTQKDKEAKKATRDQFKLMSTTLVPSAINSVTSHLSASASTAAAVASNASLSSQSQPYHQMHAAAAQQHQHSNPNPYLSVLTLAAAQQQQQLATAVALQHQIASLAASSSLNPLCLATNPVLSELYRAMGHPTTAAAIHSQAQQQQQPQQSQQGKASTSAGTLVTGLDMATNSLLQRQQQHQHQQLQQQLHQRQLQHTVSPVLFPSVAGKVDTCGTLVPKQTEGPDGANLFIYHLPVEFGDADLAGIFRPFGNVISAKVFIDKKTQLSKCFGFVSFDNASSAKSAITAMNGFRIGNKRLKVQQKKTKDKPYMLTPSVPTTPWSM